MTITYISLLSRGSDAPVKSGEGMIVQYVCVHDNNDNFLVKVLLVNLYVIDCALKSSRSSNSKLGTFLFSGCFHGKELLAFDNVFTS